MKKLSLKSILFSLIALVSISVFMTSCAKEEITVEEKIVWSDAELTAKLLSNSDFTAVVEIMNEMKQDFIAYAIENERTLARQPEVMNDFANGYSKNEAAFLAHSTNLINEFPALLEKNEEVRADILQDAMEQLNTSNRSSSCIAACDATLAAQGAATYNLYLASLSSCVAAGGDYNTCNTLYYNRYLFLYGQFVILRNQCVASC